MGERGGFYDRALWQLGKLHRESLLQEGRGQIRGLHRLLGNPWWGCPPASSQVLGNAAAIMRISLPCKGSGCSKYTHAHTHRHTPPGTHVHTQAYTCTCPRRARTRTHTHTLHSTCLRGSTVSAARGGPEEAFFRLAPCGWGLTFLGSGPIRTACPSQVRGRFPPASGTPRVLLPPSPPQKKKKNVFNSSSEICSSGIPTVGKGPDCSGRVTVEVQVPSPTQRRGLKDPAPDRRWYRKRGHDEQRARVG